MSWRDTWRATVESFLREVADPAERGVERPSGDPVASAIAGARSEVRDLEAELELTRERADAEGEAVGMCERRRLQATKIGDADTARVAERFGRRHADRQAVLRRKCEVLEDELELARTTLNELLDLAKAEAADVTRPDR